jgi:hypothetical protein
MGMIIIRIAAVFFSDFCTATNISRIFMMQIRAQPMSTDRYWHGSLVGLHDSIWDESGGDLLPTEPSAVQAINGFLG